MADEKEIKHMDDEGNFCSEDDPKVAYVYTGDEASKRLRERLQKDAPQFAPGFSTRPPEPAHTMVARASDDPDTTPVAVTDGSTPVKASTARPTR